MITQARVRELFDYREGDLVRRIAVSNTRVGNIPGCPNSRGYLRTGVDGTLYSNHRLIWL